MHLTSRKGIEADVELDFDAVCAYEDEHPDWSIIAEMRRFGKTTRFSSLDLLASFLYDGGWKAWAADGFTVADLTDAISEGLRELGFTSEEEASEESPTPSG
jgi:hypothetical protein